VAGLGQPGLPERSCGLCSRLPTGAMALSLFMQKAKKEEPESKAEQDVSFRGGYLQGCLLHSLALLFPSSAMHSLGAAHGLNRARQQAGF
jgi:hypothetical protein